LEQGEPYEGDALRFHFVQEMDTQVTRWLLVWRKS